MDAEKDGISAATGCVSNVAIQLVPSSHPQPSPSGSASIVVHAGLFELFVTVVTRDSELLASESDTRQELLFSQPQPSLFESLSAD